MSKMILADLVAPLISESDTNRMVIREIPREKLTEDSGNFYHIDDEDVSALAANIATVGLQQPLRVRREGESYVIVSGHRRFRAICQLAADRDGDGWATVPCIVEAAGSEALNELRMILANADTRKLSPADISRQAERVEALLYQLKEEGYEFPGRMRDHVAEACRVSKSKLARLKVIRDNLSASWKPRWEAGDLPESTAYELAQAEDWIQERIFSAVPDVIASGVIRVRQLMQAGADYRAEGLTGPGCAKCTHGDAFLRHDAEEYDTCKGKTCCLKCDKATRDWYPCSRMCGKAKAKRKKALEKKRAKDQAEKDARYSAMQAQIRESAIRLVKAADAAGIDDDQTIRTRYSYESVGRLRKIARGEYKDPSPYCNYLSTDEGLNVESAASVLQCSADYVCGFTDQLRPAAVSKSDTATAEPGWREGTPAAPGRYLVIMKDLPTEFLCEWNGSEFTLHGKTAAAYDMEPEWWFALPVEPLTWRREVRWRKANEEGAE